MDTVTVRARPPPAAAPRPARGLDTVMPLERRWPPLGSPADTFPPTSSMRMGLPSSFTPSYFRMAAWAS